MIRSVSVVRSIVIKKADKFSSVVVWDRLDYIKKLYKEGRKTISREIRFSGNNLTELVDRSNAMFKNLRGCSIITSRIGGGWVLAFFVMLCDRKLGR